MSGGNEALLPMGSGAGHSPRLHHKRRVLGPASSSSASPSFLNSSPSSSSGRFLDRDGPFRQSLGRMRVARYNRPRSLAALDWLHTLLHQNTYKLLIGVVLAYVGIVLVYAPLFLAISNDADLGVRGFGEAASLSLTTLMTIGCKSIPACGGLGGGRREGGLQDGLATSCSLFRALFLPLSLSLFVSSEISYLLLGITSPTLDCSMDEP